MHHRLGARCPLLLTTKSFRSFFSHKALEILNIFIQGSATRKKLGLWAFKIFLRANFDGELASPLMFQNIHFISFRSTQFDYGSINSLRFWCLPFFFFFFWDLETTNWKFSKLAFKPFLEYRLPLNYVMLAQDSKKNNIFMLNVFYRIFSCIELGNINRLWVIRATRVYKIYTFIICDLPIMFV